MGMPIYADPLQHPRRSLTPPQPGSQPPCTVTWGVWRVYCSANVLVRVQTEMLVLPVVQEPRQHGRRKAERRLDAQVPGRLPGTCSM